MLACCRWPDCPDRSEAIRAQVVPSIDWARFLRIVRRHQVEGLVYQGLRAAGISLPDPLEAGLAEAAGLIARANRGFARESMRLQEALAAAGLSFLFVKGVPLGMLAYGSLDLKMAVDIDLVVDAPDHPAAAHLVRALDYQVVADARAKHSIWRHRKTGIVLELHSAFVDNPLTLPSVSTHSPRTVVEAGPEVALPTLGRDELCAYLCVHGAGHGWSRLKWLADLNALLSVLSSADIERVHRRIAQLGAERSSAQALILCSRLFNLQLEGSFRRRLQRDIAVRFMVAAAMHSIMKGGGERELDSDVTGTIAIHLSHFFMVPGWRYKRSEYRRKLAEWNRVGRVGGDEGRAPGLLVLLWAWFAKRRSVRDGLLREPSRSRAVVLHEGSRIRRTSQFQHVQVDDQLMALDVKTGRCFRFNETATRIWSLLDESRRFDELRNVLLREFAVDTATCDTELRSMLADLHDQSLVEIQVLDDRNVG